MFLKDSVEREEKPALHPVCQETLRVSLCRESKGLEIVTVGALCGCI